MAEVVPELRSEQTTAQREEAIVEFRDRALRSRFWRTALGERLLKWFWQTRLGRWLAKRFADATPEELHGYAFWGPVALLVLVTELIGTGWFGTFARWPTISSTVGHLQDLNSLWGVPVVGLIGLAAFYALAYETRPTSEGRDEFYLLRKGWLRLRYGWPIVFGATALITIQARFFSDKDKYELGYALYGSLAFFGIVVPLVLIGLKSEHVVFPTLFYTFKRLSERFRWVAALVAAGLAILVIHLGLHPWPDLAREPAKFAGLNGPAARARAERALDENDAKPNLVYSTRARSVHRGQDAWFVYFNEATNASQTHAGCYVIVVRDAAPTVADECVS